VAFEIDGLADDGTRGRSVLMVGRAEEITDQREIDTANAERVAHWRTRADQWRVAVQALPRGVQVRVGGGLVP
jgi:hypothetical protein